MTFPGRVYRFPHSLMRRWRRERKYGVRAPIEGGYWPFHKKRHKRMAGK